MNERGIELCPPPLHLGPQSSSQPLYFLPTIYPQHSHIPLTQSTRSSANSPESSNAKKVYNCQRCLNHGIEVKRRNHKSVCPFNSCQCHMCEMVSARSELNNEFALECEEADAEVEVVDLESNSGDTSNGLLHEESRPSPLEDKPKTPADSVTKVRDPRCQQCAAHGKNFPLKNHKKICPFRKCECKKCKIVFRRRNLMAKQIKLRRQQKQKKQMEAAALDLRKQLEKMAERERQQATLFNYFQLPSVGSVVPSPSHSGLSFHPPNNCWPTHYGCSWPQQSTLSSSVPVLSIPPGNDGGTRSCPGHHFGIPHPVLTSLTAGCSNKHSCPCACLQGILSNPLPSQLPVSIGITHKLDERATTCT